MIDPSVTGELANERGWRTLDDKLRPFIRRSVKSEADVDDVLQETFLRMHRGLSSLRDDQRFGPWVYRVTRSAVIDHLRIAARHPISEGQQPEQELGARLEPEPNDIRQEVAGYAAHFVSTLPSPYREALTLTELQGLTQKQAAKRLDISVSGMKSRVQRGRRKVRAALEDCCSIALDARRRVVSCESRPDGEGAECCVESGPGDN